MQNLGNSENVCEDTGIKNCPYLHSDDPNICCNTFRACCYSCEFTYCEYKKGLKNAKIKKGKKSSKKKK